MRKITEIAQEMLVPCLHEHSIVADFTLGNGYDCEFLIAHEHKRIYAFEIQKKVMESTKKRLASKSESVSFICDGHENCLYYIKEGIDAAIFNFGYCPKADKQITTMLSTSKQAVENALRLLKVQGRIVLVIYPGHEQGKKEANHFLSWIKTLDSRVYECIKFSMENRKDCPFILCIEKIRAGKKEDEER